MLRAYEVMRGRAEVYFKNFKKPIAVTVPRTRDGNIIVI